MKRELMGYNTLINTYEAAADRGDWYWCDFVRPLIRQAVLAGQPDDVALDHFSDDYPWDV